MSGLIAKKYLIGLVGLIVVLVVGLVILMTQLLSEVETRDPGLEYPVAEVVEGEGEVSKMDDESRIADSLRRLLQSNSDEAWMAVASATDGPFVRFAGSAKEPIYFNFPLADLSESQRIGALRILAETPGASESEDFGFELILERHAIDAAARLAIRVFREVYEFDLASPLIITEGFN